MNSLRILLGAIILLTLLPVKAGVVSKVDVSDTQIEKEKEVSLTFKFADSPSAIACGLSIDWGDGKIERFRVGEGQQIPPPYKINHLYSLPNNYKVRINGELLVRGLRSVPACDVKQEGTITVFDPVEVAKRAQEKAEAEKEQRARNEAEAIVRKEREEAAKVAAIAKAAKDAEERAKQQVEIAKNIVSNWEIGLVYNFFGEGSCKQSGEKRCIPNTREYEKACKAAEGMTNNIAQTFSAFGGDLFKNGEIIDSNIRWNGILCWAEREASGIVNGNSMRRKHSLKVVGFIKNSKGAILVHEGW